MCEPDETDRAPGPTDPLADRRIQQGRMPEGIPPETPDPAIGSFLAFLAADMARHPENIAPFPEELAARMAALTAGIEVDPDEDFGAEIDI